MFPKREIRSKDKTLPDYFFATFQENLSNEAGLKIYDKDGFEVKQAKVFYSPNKALKTASSVNTWTKVGQAVRVANKPQKQGDTDTTYDVWKIVGVKKYDFSPFEEDTCLLLEKREL